jgi:DinB family protein
MTLPRPVAQLWDDLQAVRAEILAEVRALSQRQADWKPDDREWSVGEVIHHLTVAEVNTGKLTTKLTKEAQAAGAPAAFPADLATFAPVPRGAAGRAEAPPAMWPDHGKPVGDLLAAITAARERSRQSIDKLAACDPRTLTFTHARLGNLDLAQWWLLMAEHDRDHLAQIRSLKAAPGFPTS